MSLFEHSDADGDRLEVGGPPEEWTSIHDGCLAFTVTRKHGDENSASLPREAAKRLWTALGEWLHPDAGSAPLPYANQSLIEQMIQRAVAAQVSAVLPLHLAPVATCNPCPRQVGANCIDCGPADPEPHDVGHADEPVAKTCPHGLLWSLRCPECPNPDGLRQHPTEDEWAQAPGRRVGNDGVALPYCKEQYGGCGHSWGQHTGGACKARNFDLSNRAHNPCGCTSRPPSAAHSEYDREGEPVKAKCTCHIHRHQAVDGSRECTHSGCFCRSSAP